jgi:hypothetical protein
MEIADGGDMARAISAAAKADDGRGRPFPAEQVVTWALQICLALEHAHQLKVKGVEV